MGHKILFRKSSNKEVSAIISSGYFVSKMMDYCKRRIQEDMIEKKQRYEELFDRSLSLMSKTDDTFYFSVDSEKFSVVIMSGCLYEIRDGELIGVDLIQARNGHFYNANGQRMVR